MTEEAKRDWFAVAWETLKDIPPHILATGAKKARLHADHPSKIVPLIADEAAKLMVRERSIDEAAKPLARRPLLAPNYCSPEEAREILNQYGLKRDWS